MVEKGRLLVVSYAFPPLKVAMAPCVAKTTAAIHKQGYVIDVISADLFAPLTSYYDDSLIDYVKRHTLRIDRLRPHLALCPRTIYTFILQWLACVSSITRLSPLRKLCQRIQQRLYPDPMAQLKHSAVKALRTRLKNTAYNAVITFAPFHSVNPVMAQIKKEFPTIFWIAQFSDPWAYNPLEHNNSARQWARRHEPNTIRRADLIIHNAQPSLDLMVRTHGEALREKATVIPHPFDATLYFQKPRNTSGQLILRHVGVLFENRTPEPLFIAMNLLLNRRPHLSTVLSLEFYGVIAKPMLQTEAARSLPSSMIKCMPYVSYVESLDVMRNADILLLIEADSECNLFMPSKMSDYLGAGPPILAIVPSGPAQSALERLGGKWQARPTDPYLISLALEQIIDYVQQSSDSTQWCSNEAREEFDVARIGYQYHEAIQLLSTK